MNILDSKLFQLILIMMDLKEFYKNLYLGSPTVLAPGIHKTVEPDNMYKSGSLELYRVDGPMGR